MESTFFFLFEYLPVSTRLFVFLLFCFSVLASHLPQFFLQHFGASGGAILSLSLVKEKEPPKKEKSLGLRIRRKKTAVWPYTTKPDRHFAYRQTR